MASMSGSMTEWRCEWEELEKEKNKARSIFFSSAIHAQATSGPTTEGQPYLGKWYDIAFACSDRVWFLLCLPD
jgi:hypothetical protein